MKNLFDTKKLIIFALLIISMFTISFTMNYLLGGMINNIEFSLYDFMARLSEDGKVRFNNYPKASDEVVILAVDNDSEKIDEKFNLNLGRWPWPRKTWSDVVEYISQGEPKSIVFDLRFEGKEGNTPEHEQSDAALTETIKNHENIVLGILLSKPGIAQRKAVPTAPPFRKQPGLKIDDSKIFLSKSKTDILKYTTFYDYHPLNENFILNAKYIGATNQVLSTNDSVIRSHVPLYRLITQGGNYYIPSLPLAAVLSVLPEEEKKPFKLTQKGIVLGKRFIPLDNKGKFFINWHGGPKTYKFISVKDVLLKNVSPEVFKDKIVIIGRVKDGTDIHSTSVAMNSVGPEIMATCIDNILNDTKTSEKSGRKFITKTGALANLVITVLFCIFTGLYIRRTTSNAYSFIWLVFTLLAYILFALASFVYFRYWINITYPVIFITATAIGVYLYKLHISNKQRNEIKQLLGRFVSPQVFKKLLENPSVISRQGDKKVLTVLFSDIRGFTTLSESMPPNLLVSQLNEYFNEIYEIILKHNGTLDKYIGDAIMAFFGDPLPVKDHAAQAVKTAIEMKKALDRLNSKWASEDRPTLDIGVGINTGEMVVGPVGAKKMISYTVMGDNVNIASRLEGLNKEYKSNIIISHSTYDQVKDCINAEYLGEVTVKGKHSAVKIYKVDPRRIDLYKN